MLKALVTAGSQIFKNFTSVKAINSLTFTSNFSKWMNSNQKSLLTSAYSGNNQLDQRSPYRSLLHIEDPNVNFSRSVTKFSLKTGKRRTVRAVITRFYRLDTGLWIRRRAGCHKHLHRRNFQSRYEKVQHVFCTKTQSIMFDKMVTKTYKKKRYYIDDPYEPYQVRNNFDWVLPFRPM